MGLPQLAESNTSLQGPRSWMSTSLKCWIGSKSYVWSMNRVASGMNDGRFQQKLPEFNWDPAAWLTTKMGLVRWWHGKCWVRYGGMVYMIVHSSSLMHHYCRYSAWKKHMWFFHIPFPVSTKALSLLLASHETLWTFSFFFSSFSGEVESNLPPDSGYRDRTRNIISELLKAKSWTPWASHHIRWSL